MGTRNHNRQYVVVRFDRSQRPVIKTNIVYATCDKAAAVVACAKRITSAKPDEYFEAMRRSTYEQYYMEDK